MFSSPISVNRAWDAQLLAGILLLSLASVFLVSLAFPGNWGVLLLILVYSNLLPTVTAVLGYHALRGSRPSSALILSVAILSVLTLPISTIYYIPLGVGCIVLATFALQRRSLDEPALRRRFPVVAAMILWPALMVATLILSGRVVPGPFDPLFTGMSLPWAVTGFELVIRAHDSSAGPNQERDLGTTIWIERLPLVLAVGMAATVTLAISFRSIPKFSLWDQFLDVLVLTVGFPLVIVGFGNLLIASYHRWMPKLSGFLPA